MSLHVNRRSFMKHSLAASAGGVPVVRAGQAAESRIVQTDSQDVFVLGERPAASFDLIVATGLRGEELTSAVRSALGATSESKPAVPVQPKL